VAGATLDGIAAERAGAAAAQDTDGFVDVQRQPVRDRVRRIGAVQDLLQRDRH
jgi:hypothetical protein